MLTSSYPRFRGDIAGTFVKSLAVSVARQGHGVHVVAPYDGPGLRGAAPKCNDGVIEHHFAYAPLSALRQLGYAKSLVGDRRLKLAAYAMAIPYGVSGLAKARSVAKRHGCDVLHAHWVLPSGPIAALVARERAIPLVVSLHGSDVFVAERNPILGRVTSWSLRRAAAVIASSANLRSRAILLGARPEDAAVVPYGVTSDMFRGQEDAGKDLRRALGIGAEDLVVLGLGRLVYKKGFHYLLEAWPMVLRERPRAKLVIGGDGHLADELRTCAHRLGIGAVVSFPGLVPSDKVPTFMAAADLFVMPSITDDSGNVDGLPNVVLEAMAAGKAVVATRVGGHPAVISDGETGLLVEERSPRELAAAILRLLADSVLRQGCAVRAQKMVTDNLDWSSVAKTFVELYRQVAGQTLSRG